MFSSDVVENPVEGWKPVKSINSRVRVLEFFGDEVEEVPTAEGKQARIKGQGHLRGFVAAFKGVFEVFHAT